MADDVLILIPARMAASRLPGKPLADIAGVPMIVRVWRQAVKADIGPVVVAVAEEAVVAAVERAGGTAVLTDPDLASGSDRVHEALTEIDRTLDGVVYVFREGKPRLVVNITKNREDADTW